MANIVIASSHISREIMINPVDITLSRGGIDYARGEALNVPAIFEVYDSVCASLLMLTSVSVASVCQKILVIILVSLISFLSIGFAISLIIPKSVVFLDSISSSILRSSYTPLEKHK